MSNLATPRQMSKPNLFSTTVQINDCNYHPLMVACDLLAMQEDGGWSFQVIEIKTVEVVIANKIGADITPQVKASMQMRHHIEMSVLMQQEDLYTEFLKAQEVAA